MCGAPVASLDSPCCEHCGARLATVACPSCFGIIFQGAKFCSHCGAKVDRTEVAAAATELCPRCKVDMNAVVVGNTDLRECPRCEGIWVDKAAFEQLCADREKQSAVLGLAAPLPTDLVGNIETNIRYLPCPLCNSFMNRVNFAHCSHVIVDVCGQHGTWFDRDELRRIVEFIRAGGLEKARTQEIEELRQQRNQLESTRTAGAMIGDSWNSPSPWPTAKYDLVDIGISAAAQVLKSFLK
jgi:Zn-finger nucleic acid-binding protein